jgi:hypothetical protein
VGLNLTRTHLASGRKKNDHQDSVPHQVDAGRAGLRLDTPVRVLPRGAARLGVEFRELFMEVISSLVGGLEHGFYFPFHIWDVILPIDFHIFQRGCFTTNQYY